MARPFVLAQLSDPHVGGSWAPGRDAEAGLAAAIAGVRAAFGAPPDAVLVTGDLTDHATGAEYERVRGLLASLEAPLHVVPGNHDDRALSRIVERHPQILRIAAGHLHRTTTASLAGRPVLVAPSTYAQLQLNATSDDAIELSDEPPGFVVHTLVDGELVSFVQPCA